MAILMVPAVAATHKQAADTQKTVTGKAIPSGWPAESLTGTIMSVDPQKRIMVLKDSSGVPFDMILSHSTRIKAGQRELKPGELASEVNKKATIKFVPERRGDIAESIQMNG